MGKPELQVVTDVGVVLRWRSARDDEATRVVQVESVAEAVRAYVRAGIVAEADATKEQQRLEQELALETQTRKPSSHRPEVGRVGRGGEPV